MTNEQQESENINDSTYLLGSGSESIPKPPKKSIIWNVCSFILVTEFCERLAYYGLTGSLPIFFRKHLGMNSVLATEMNNTFTSLTYMTPLFGAYIADTYLGRFSTIMIFSLIYLAGLLFCVIASIPSVSSISLFIIGLFGLVAFGAGGIKPNVVVLGADQFDMSIPEQRLEKDSFFNWFYWAINIGATFSFGVLTNIAVNGIPPYISPDYGFFTSFLIPAAAFVVAFVVFYSGKSRYRRVPPHGSALSDFFAVIIHAGTRSLHGNIILSAGFAFIAGIVITTSSYFINDESLHLTIALIGAGCVIYGTQVMIITGHSTAWLNLAMEANGGCHTPKQVQDAKQVMRLSPYMSIIIIFWAVYAQQASNFVLQGCQMDLRIDKGSTNAPLVSSAMLSILDSGVILVLIPLFDRCVYPMFSSIGIQPTVLRKIGMGLFFCILSMIVAASLEKYRKRLSFVDGMVSNCAAPGENLLMSKVSVWWQTPQYLLIGIGEVLTSISSYDLFYSEVPESMRSVCQALNLLTTTLGFIVASGLNSIFSFWIPSDLNHGHLENVFYVLAAMVIANLLAFLIISQSFKYHTPSAITENDIVSGFSPAMSRAARHITKRFRRQPK